VGGLTTVSPKDRRSRSLADSVSDPHWFNADPDST
jgi:hypothetical protein